MREKIKNFYVNNQMLYNKAPIRFSAHDRILIVTPHQDDETLGCGALIAKYYDYVDILLVTNGEKGNPEYTVEETVCMRNREFSYAVEGCHAIYQMNLMDSDFTYREFKKKEFAFSKYNYIFVPNRYEDHPDHAKICRYLYRIKKSEHLSARIVEYEVWTPLRRFNYYLDFSDFADLKWEKINLYKSQLKNINYLEKIKGLNCYRGMATASQYAECYFLPFNMNERLKGSFCKMITNYLRWRKNRLCRLMKKRGVHPH